MRPTRPMHPHHHGCEEPTRVEGEDILNALFPEGIVPEGGVMPPPLLECQHGRPPKPCPPKPPMMHDMYRVILNKLLRLVYNMQKSLEGIDGNVTNIENRIESGEINIEIDDAMSATSENPVQNKVIHAAIKQLRDALAGIEGEVGDCKCEVDDAMSITSTNPVQNKVIKAKLDELEAKIGSGTGGGGGSTGGGEGCDCIIDPDLSPTSKNAVQNLAIYAALKRLEEKIGQGGGTDPDDPDTPVQPAPDVDFRLVTVYKASDSKPSRPTGGNFDFVANKPVLPQGGWNTTIPKDGKVWMSYNTFRSNNTNAGWTDPVEYIDFNGILDKVDKQLDELYQQLLDEARADFADAIKNAQAAAEQAKKDLANAKQMLQDAKDLLAALDESEGDAGISLEESLAKIKLFADWYDTNAGTVTNLTEELDAVKGTITQHGAHINTLTDTVNEATRQLDAVNGIISDEVVRVNVNTGEVTRVGNLIDAMSGKIASNGWYHDVNSGKTVSVKDEMDALKGKITQEVSQVYETKANVSIVKTELDAAKTAWSAKAEKLEGDIAEVAKLTVTPEGISAAVTKDLAGDKLIGAALKLAINGDESDAVIGADHIYLDGDVLAKAIKTGDLTIYNSTNAPVTHLASDGSGYLAGGKITWETTGDISIGNWTVNEKTLTGGNLVLDSKGEIRCASGIKTYWALKNDGSASFGSGKFNIAADGTITQNAKQVGGTTRYSLIASSNGTGAIAYGNISWDSAGDLTMTGGSTSTKWKMDWSGLTYQNDETGLGKQKAYVGLNGLTVENQFTNEMFNINPGGVFIKVGSDKYLGATRTITVNGQTLKFVKGILVSNDAPIVFPPAPADL